MRPIRDIPEVTRFVRSAVNDPDAIEHWESMGSREQESAYRSAQKNAMLDSHADLYSMDAGALAENVLADAIIDCYNTSQYTGRQRRRTDDEDDENEMYISRRRRTTKAINIARWMQELHEQSVDYDMFYNQFKDAYLESNNDDMIMDMGEDLGDIVDRS